MKQLISDWLLNTKREPSVRNLQSPLSCTGIYPEAKLPSDEGKLLLLTYLYLELRLNLEHALRAASADLTASRVQTRRQWVEQHQ